MIKVMFSINVTFVFIIHSEVFRVKENVFKSNCNTAFFNKICCSIYFNFEVHDFLLKKFINNQKTLLIVGESEGPL